MNKNVKEKDMCQLTIKLINMFENRNLHECDCILNTLSTADRSENISIRLNRAIVDFEMGTTNLTDLRLTLSTIHSTGGDANDKGFRLSNVLLFNLSLASYREYDFVSARSYLSQIVLKDQPESFIRFVCPLRFAIALALRDGPEAIELSENIKSNGDDSTSLCKARALIISKEYKLFIEEVDALYLSGRGRLMSVEFLRAQVEYMTGNNLKSIQLLNDVSHANYGQGDEGLGKTTLDSLSVSLGCCFYNNMACIHLMINKPHLAAHYYRQALTESRKHIVQDRECEWRSCMMLYNLALALLNAGLYGASFSILLDVYPWLGRRPHVWLHLAQCCILSRGRGIDFGNPKAAKCWRHCAIPSNGGKTVCDEECLDLTKDIPPLDSGSATLSTFAAKFASLCLKNAITSRSSDVTETFLASIWVNIAYVQLCLGEYEKAFVAAQKVLNHEPLSEEHLSLCRLYSGEALVHLGDAEKAEAQLTPSILPTSGSKDLLNVLTYNLSATRALYGDFERAEAILSKNLWPALNQMSCLLSTRVTSLKLFILLVRKSGQNMGISMCKKFILCRPHPVEMIDDADVCMQFN